MVLVFFLSFEAHKTKYLFSCSDEQVAAASTDAIKSLASYPEGMVCTFSAPG